MQNPGGPFNIPPDPRDAMAQRVKELEDRIRRLETARSGNAMTVDGPPGITISNGGGIRIEDGGTFQLRTPADHKVLFAGTIEIPDGSGRTQQIFQVNRDDGSPAFVLADLGTTPGHPHMQALVWIDRAGNVIFADDTDGGAGLARPYLPAGVFAEITPPTVTTSSGSYQAMHWADCFEQNPKVTASVLVQTSAGTAGQIRLTTGPDQIGSVVSIPAGSFGQFTIPAAPWPNFIYEARVTVQLEARVTSGPGTIGVRPLSIWGVQT
jgi:hypothetical protein